MSSFVSYEVQFRIMVPNSTTPVFCGTGRISSWHEVALNSAAAALTAEALIIDSTTVLGSPTATAAVTESINAARIASAASVGLLGVTLEGIKARTGATGVGMSTGRVAGIGSIVPVRTNGTATAGTMLVSSSTAGQVTDAATKAATVPAYGVSLGVCLVANASVGGVNIAGVYVSCA